MKDDKIWSTLQRKLIEKPDHSFDQKFWHKFNNEFKGKVEKKGLLEKLYLDWSRNWIYGAGLAGAALLVMILIYNPFDRYSNTKIVSFMGGYEIQLVEMEPMLENLDFFSEVNDIDISEEEWNFLLTGHFK